MIPVGARVRCLAIDYIGELDSPINAKGVVIAHKGFTDHAYEVKTTYGNIYFFRPHQIVEIPIYKTEIYKSLTEGE